MSLYRILLTAAASAAFLAAQNSPSQQPNRRGENPYSQSQNSSNQSQDHAFLQKADQANQAEIMMGKLAEQKASNSSVKSYAERIVNDHTKNLKQLESLAKDKGVTLPTESSQSDVNSSEKSEYQKLSGMSGSEFDQAFIKDMIQDHQMAISEFEKEMRTTSDSDIRSYINMTLPTLRAHLSEAEQLQRTVQGD
ncbi:MAG TPA: DUF4142 domain-containing protein [Bryobacteraceae bacterium]|nr:DUF4142 domain-containing protein [Bryobacteraceae bacterium]